jgi:outer membrane lipopolysaccharide assembly protein LptE/RlpB
MPSRLAIFLLLLLVAVGGCGYHLPGRGQNLPPDVQSVAFVFFRNATLEPLLENVVSEALVNRLIRGRALRVVDRPEAADAVLSGVVSAYSAVPVAYDQEDEIARWRSTMTVGAELRRAGGGEVLWRGSVTWREEYAASRDKALQEDFEAIAIATMSQRIAEELYFQLADNF